MSSVPGIDVQPVASDPVLSVIGHFVAEAQIEANPATMRMVRDALIDVLGCILVGAGEEVTVKTIKAMLHRTGASAVYGTGMTLAPEAAAMVNAVAGHAIDFDDWEIPGNTHPSITIIPALLAASEGHPISGRAFAEAYIVGFEVIAKLGEGLNYEHYDTGWHTTATFGPLGASAAVARLWGLDEKQAMNAVGIAVSRASGLTAQFGSDCKPLQAGFAAEAGIVSATLANAGLTARSTALEGRGGFNALTAHGNDLHLSSTFASMGTPLSLTTHGLVFKPYPSCGYTHRIVDAALALRKRIDDLSRISKIEIALPDFHAAVLPFHVPTSAREARFSLPFCAALALIHGRVTVADFTQDMWTSAPIADLMAKTTILPFPPNNPSLNYDPNQPDCLKVHFADGSSEEESVAYPLGAPQLPMTSDYILQKFAENVLCETTEDSVRSLLVWLETSDLLSHT